MHDIYFIFAIQNSFAIEVKKVWMDMSMLQRDRTEGQTDEKDVEEMQRI